MILKAKLLLQNGVFDYNYLFFFQFPSETNQKLKFKEIEIGPSQKVSFGVCFEPSKTSLYMGKICLKPRNLARPLRCDVSASHTSLDYVRLGHTHIHTRAPAHTE